MTGYRELSYWMSTVDDPLTPRPPLPGDCDADVAIVGAGYTGLWTAYYLAAAMPSLRIAVIEAHIAGYGASGRNGGWCSALLPTSVPALARRYGREPALALHRAMVSTVDEVGRVARAEGIDCHYRKGGSVTLARTPAQLARAQAEAAEAAEYGLGVELLDGPEAARRCAATGATGPGRRAASDAPSQAGRLLGGTYTPDCAAIHPARLVRGLAAAVERRGVRVYERTRALALRPGAVLTPRGTVRAPVVVRATEGYTPALPGLRREIAPIYSLMIATEPLPPALWESIGLRDRETFSDHRRVIVYGQRTADGRLAFGGRGAPYHFGSRIRPGYDRDPRVFAALRRTLVELFPPLRGVEVQYAWGGPLGVARDWAASVGRDRRTGLAWAGGYVGDGVGAANLAGRTLADLILDRDSELVRLPWVGHRSPRWEPEPLRWLGANAGIALMGAADAAEERTGRVRPAGPDAPGTARRPEPVASRAAAAFSRLLGR